MFLTVRIQAKAEAFSKSGHCSSIIIYRLCSN